MFSNVFVLLKKDFSLFFKNRAAVSLTFIVPFAMIWIFGLVFGVNRKDSGPTGVKLAIVNQCPDPAAAKLVEALRSEKTFSVVTTKKVGKDQEVPLTEADLRPLIQDDAFRFALVLPEDLIPKDQLGLHLKILSNPRNDIETQLVNGILQRTIFTQAPQLLAQSLKNRTQSFLGAKGTDDFNRSLAKTIAGSFGGDENAVFDSLSKGNFGLQSEAASNDGKATDTKTPDLLGKLFKIDSEQVVGKDVVSPMATRTIGGFAMQFLLFALSASASALLIERDLGLFHRLLASPLTRWHILASKFIYGVLLGLLQLLVLFTAGHFLFGIDIQSHLPLLVLTCAFAAAACTSFGMLLASLASTPEAANGMATLTILCMSALGGAWFPLSLMPETIQKVAHVTIVYWAMNGFDLVLWNHAPFLKLLPTLGVLAGITTGVMGIAIWRFQKSRIFD